MAPRLAARRRRNDYGNGTHSATKTKQKLAFDVNADLTKSRTILTRYCALVAHVVGWASRLTAASSSSVRRRFGLLITMFVTIVYSWLGLSCVLVHPQPEIIRFKNISREYWCICWNDQLPYVDDVINGWSVMTPCAVWTGLTSWLNVVTWTWKPYLCAFKVMT